MQATRTPFGLHWPIADQDVNERLSWLIAVNTYEAEQRRLYRTAREEEEMRLMRHPIPTQKAFALFGLLLGLLPPAAIFLKLLKSFGYEWLTSHINWVVILYLLSMILIINAVCSLVGYKMGHVMGRQIDNVERQSWDVMLFVSVLLGIGWGVITGASGGAVIFIIGGLYGALCAALVGAVAFPLLTSLHRLLARGGMIDARHFWPLVFGVTMTIAMFILGM